MKDTIFSNACETEQVELKELVNRLEVEITEERKQRYNLEKFIAKVKKVTEIEELTPALVHEFISKIEVHKPCRENGVRYQQIVFTITELVSYDLLPQRKWKRHSESISRINKKRHNRKGYTVI